MSNQIKYTRIISVCGFRNLQILTICNCQFRQAETEVFAIYKLLDVSVIILTLRAYSEYSLSL